MALIHAARPILKGAGEFIILLLHEWSRLRLLRQTSPLQRSNFIEALRAGVAVLTKTSQQRQILPKKEVPSITTPAYLAHCQAFYTGDYRAAKAQAECKLANLSK